MIRFIKWTGRLVFQNIAWKLLSLAVAVALWALVASEPELSTFATVPVEYKNLPDDLEISSNPGPDIALELQGPSGELRSIGESGLHPQVILDMGGAAPGERTYPVSSGAVKLPRGVRLMRAIPSQVRFDFERRASRTVPVVVRVSGEGQPGYAIVSRVARPATLGIVGPASRVARITSAITDPVDVSNVVGLSEFHVNAFLDDPYVRFQKSPQVDVTITVKKK